MEKFVIHGGKPLKGEIEVRGSKNAATSILAATLLTSEPCIVDNLPLIEDVFRMIEILKSLGSEIEWLGRRKMKIQTKKISLSKMNKDFVCLMRSSILLLGPLFARLGWVKIPHPGGCLIGARPLDTHLDAFSQLGAEVRVGGEYEISRRETREAKVAKDIKGTEVVLREFSVTATENILMAASLIPQETVIKMAACEPHVQDLVDFLKKMGVKIKGKGTHDIKILGQKKLSGARHRLISDPIEAGTFAIAAIATKGRIKIKNFPTEYLETVLSKLKEFNAKFKVQKNLLIVEPSGNTKATKVQAMPYPGIPTDLQAPFGILATQAEGTSLIHDPLFEGRLKYIDELKKMGANAIICDPHRALVTGPTALYGQEIRSFDLRAGATLIIAGLIAEGETVIHDIYQVDRGYERIEERLRKLGVDIKRIKE